MDVRPEVMGIYGLFQVKWRELMKSDKAVKQSFISGEHHAQYMISRRQGVPEYDMLV